LHAEYWLEDLWLLRLNYIWPLLRVT
jgi:hypothetical protein